MSIQAQAGTVQAWPARGAAQLAAVFVFLVALFVGLIGLAIVLRPSVAATTTEAIYQQTHPVMVDRGVDTFASSPTILAPSEWSLTHPVMADRVPGPIVATSSEWSLTHPVMADRGAAYAATIPSVNAATGFNLAAVGSSDMSGAANAATTPSINTATGFNLAAVGSSDMSGAATTRSISPVGAHDLLTARYAATHPGMLDRGANR
jgi:hypothetical protein